jgi:hypothetical protein
MLSKVFNPDNQFYFVVAGGTLGTLAFGKLLLNFTSFFTHLAPTVVAKYGFYTGFGASTAMTGLALFTYDTLTIRANPVFEHCLGKVQANAEVEQALVSTIRTAVRALALSSLALSSFSIGC